jgi:hypothetical protein
MTSLVGYNIIFGSVDSISIELDENSQKRVIKITAAVLLDDITSWLVDKWESGYSP